MNDGLDNDGHNFIDYGWKMNDYGWSWSMKGELSKTKYFIFMIDYKNLDICFMAYVGVGYSPCR